MFLYNPANNTHRLLPPIPTQKRYDEYLGLCYDSHTDDYKVVRVSQKLGVNLEMYVYCMRENALKFIKDDSVSLQKYFLHQALGTGADGVLRFMALTIDDKPVLMCFDVRTETFSILDYTELDCYEFDKVMVELRELSGCLCLIVNYRLLGQLLYADVWEIREHEKEVPCVRFFRIRRSEACCLLEKGKLLVEVDCAWFGWYDLVTKSVKKVETHGLRDGGWCDMAMTYVESLVSVTNHKAKHLSFEGVQAEAMINHQDA